MHRLSDRSRSTQKETIVIDQLWGLDFGKGSEVNGDTNQLFFMAGPENYSKGQFGVIKLRP